MSDPDASAPAGAAIEWRDDGAPINRSYGDIYFSQEDGRAETEHVFLAGCGLPGAFAGADAFQTAELGFGLGLSTACLLAAWRRAPKRPALSITSFEIAPASLEEMRRALAPWPDLAPLPNSLAQNWPPRPGENWYALDPQGGGARLQLIIGDATALTPRWDGAADAWFLDGFSPAKNPELWGRDLLATVFARTRPGGVFATYAAAGWVRRNLESAGFAVTRRPGFGRKREMLTGARPA